MNLEILCNITGVKLRDLLKICGHYFGDPLIKENHYIFATPWEDDPVISIQEDGVFAMEYQVKIVMEALVKLEAQNERH